MKRPEYLADEVPKMAAELVRLRARVASLEAALREVEWGDHDEMEEACCPSCASHAFRGYHQQGCRLAAALAPRSERREGEPVNYNEPEDANEVDRCAVDSSYDHRPGVEPRSGLHGGASGDVREDGGHPGVRGSGSSVAPPAAPRAPEPCECPVCREPNREAGGDET